MDFKQNCRLKSLEDGVQMDSIWNLWGRVKYSSNHEQSKVPSLHLI